jgi:hypothetical protein
MMDHTSERVPFGNEHEDQDEGEAFRIMLLEAGDLDTRPSAEHIDQLRQVLARRLVSVRRARPRKSWRAWRWCAAGVGIVLAAAVAFVQLPLQPRFVWAQVVQAVHERPWIHGIARDSQGIVDEFWLSLPRELAATRHGDFVRHDDLRAGIRYEFDARKRLLVRRPVGDVGEFESVARMFRAIFRGDTDVEIGSGHRITKRDRRSIHVDGRDWLEYEWALSRYEDGKTASATMRVDPERKLPVSLAVTAAGESVRYAFDFPTEGPADIYALGVPRLSQVDDQLPSLETARIARAMEAGRKDLDHYFAVEYEYLTQARLVWRKGDKWRVELYLSRGDPGDLHGPAPGEDVLKWWRGQMKGKDAEFHPLYVCDGWQIWRHETQTGWKRERFVAPGKGHYAAMTFADAMQDLLEFHAYPRIDADGRFVNDPTHGSTKNDASNLQRDSPKTARTLFEVGNADIVNERLWLDPDHGFATVRSETRFHLSPEELKEPNPVVRAVHEFDRFDRTPRGVWYATLRRSKQFRRDGTQAYATKAVHFAVDFGAELPELLFTPSGRK